MGEMTARFGICADRGYEQMVGPSKRGNEFSLFKIKAGNFIC